MKILFISEDPEISRGIPIYSVPLANELAKMGNDIWYLYSGTYLDKYSIFPRIKFWKAKDINYLELRNLTMPFNFTSPIKDVYNKHSEELILRSIKKINPEMIHVHSMIGLSSNILLKLQLFGYLIVNTFHEYWFLCQRRVLIDKNGAPCEGPSPSRCNLCTNQLSLHKQILKGYIKKINKRLLNKFVEYRRSHSEVAKFSPQLPGSNIDRYFEYFIREKININVLNRLDLNLAVSNFVKKVFNKYGVLNSKMAVNHIGTTAPLTITPRGKVENLDKFVFGYIGGLSEIKGIHLAIDAFRQIHDNNLKFIIYGGGGSFYQKLLREKADPRVEFKGKYNYSNLSNILANMDCIVIPPICFDTSPQTIFEAFSAKKPVVASRIGGIPDFITHEKNGLLFEPQNIEDLEAQMRRILSENGLIQKLKNGIEKPKTISEHAKELMDIYNEIENVNGMHE